MLLLRIIYVISVLFCYAFMHICLLMPCGHLLGKGWLLGSRFWCLIVRLSLSHWYPVSSLVPDCIDSWFLPSFLLWLRNKKLAMCPGHSDAPAVAKVAYSHKQSQKWCILMNKGQLLLKPQDNYDHMGTWARQFCGRKHKSITHPLSWKCYIRVLCYSYLG